MQNRNDIQTRGFDVIFKKDALEFIMKWPHPIVRQRFNKDSSRWEQVQVRKIPQSWINDIARVAAWPEWARNFAESYVQAPDLAAALLNHLHQKWAALETSKAGKLKRFLSQNTAVKWEPGFGPANTVAINKLLEWQKTQKPFVGARAVTKKDEKFWAENPPVEWKPGDGAARDCMGMCNIWHLQDGQIATAFEHSLGGEVVDADEVAKARKWVVANQRAGESFAEKVLDKDGYLHLEEKPLRRKKGGKPRRK
jgi:hypothetical protein